MKSMEPWMATLTTSCAKCSDAQNVTSTCLPANCSGNTAKVKRTSRRQTNPRDSSWWTAGGVEQHAWADAERAQCAAHHLLTTELADYRQVSFLSLTMASHLITWLYDWQRQCQGIQKGFSFCRSLIHFSYLSSDTFPIFHLFLKKNFNAKLIIFI